MSPIPAKIAKSALADSGKLTLIYFPTLPLKFAASIALASTPPANLFKAAACLPSFPSSPTKNIIALSVGREVVNSEKFIFILVSLYPYNS